MEDCFGVFNNSLKQSLVKIIADHVTYSQSDLQKRLMSHYLFALKFLKCSSLLHVCIQRVCDMTITSTTPPLKEIIWIAFQAIEH